VRGTRVRRRGTGEAWPTALLRLITRNRRRHGGYIVHVGFAILVASVAVSSVFKDLHREHAELGHRMTVGPYELRYVDAIGRTVLHEGRIRKIVLGAVVDVYRDGRKERTIRPTREYFPTTDTAEGPVGRFFLGESATEVALQAGLTRDLWVAMQPDGDALAELILDVDKRLLNQRAPFAQGEIAAAGLAEVYRRGPPPVTFQVILSPMVTWIWIGTLIMALGAALALWPGRDPDARRVRARTTARVARELRDGGPVPDDQAPEDAEMAGSATR
ncbi:MAG: cytochrome c-type biogenesis CcmF C-terminal domain-containing protein, partial [Solirubrobacteraceae bacterium]